MRFVNDHDPLPLLAQLQARYGVTGCTVLVVAPSGPRLEAIARIVADVHQGIAANYRFLAEERVNPLTIRRRWQRMGGVIPPRAGRRGTGALPTVTLVDDVLWAPLPGEQTA